MIERDETETSADEPTPTSPDPAAADPAETEPAQADTADSDGANPERPEAEAEAEVIDLGAHASEIARLRAQLEESSARLRTVSKAYTDLQQEMDAFRKRQQVLAEAKAERKAGEVVERFFEPVQNLKRALEAEGSAQDLRDGVKLVLQQFSRQLEVLGLTEVPGIGSTFDPKVHDALALMPVTDPAQDGKVIAVHSTGWKVGDRVIQPAQVVIGKLQEPAEA